MALRAIIEEGSIKVTDYSKLSDEQLDASIVYYEGQHGSLEVFSNKIGKYPMKSNNEVRVDWEYLLREREERKSG